MVKSKKVGRKAAKTKSELKRKVNSALRSLQHKAETIKSFFSLPYTKYAAV